MTILHYLRSHKDVTLLIILSILFFFLFFKKDGLGYSLFPKQPTMKSSIHTVHTTLFDIQCIDTMKISRDKAREKIDEIKMQTINEHVKKIKAMGANCIAIGTPYNEEFIPYMKIWVREARKQNLRVWFRGNWAEWEGWFNYPKNMTTTTHIQKTKTFILDHPELFEDGDIFTPAPEAENGGPFAPVDTHKKHMLFRSFLISEHMQTQEAFSSIKKNVITNWLSMSGGVAKGSLDKATIQEIGSIVTLDHYVKNPEGMDEYIEYFHDTYHVDIILGEFGAPIPDLNGEMTEKEQAEFVDALFQRLYYHIPYVKGVNYWTLSESSTALITHTGDEKEVVTVIKKYYQPGVFKGKVINKEGQGIPFINLQRSETQQITTTNETGEFTMTIPAKSVKIFIAGNQQYNGRTIHISPKSNEEIHATITLDSHQTPFFSRIKTLLNNLTR